MAHSPYLRFSLMIATSFAVMYLLMYAMVDRLADVYLNVNELYMAGLMAAAMAIIEIVVMRRMYPNRRTNVGIVLASTAVLAILWVAIRMQILVNDSQFLRSMIPHHAGAILMCEEASTSDAAVEDLCRRIIAGQQSEIDEMQASLTRLDR